MTLTSIGWAHEGDCGRPGSWDRSALGFPSTWDHDELLPGCKWPPSSANGYGHGKGKSRSSSFSLSSMPPSHSLEHGYRNGSSAGTRTRSGTVVPGSSSSPPSPGAQGQGDLEQGQSHRPPQPPLSVAIDYSGTPSTSHPAWTHTRTASASSLSSAYGASGYDGAKSPFTPTPTGVRSPAGSFYGSGVASPSVGSTVIAFEENNAAGPGAGVEAGRQGWRKVGGGETTEEEVARRKMEEEERELMG